jgi:aspartate 1-decarboxylase
MCAAALCASAMTSSMNMVNVYMINGETVENFDGSQLVGKTVTETDDDMVIIINGKKSSAEEMKKIKPEMIDEVIVFDACSEGAAKWTDSKDKKVVVIQLKSDSKVPIIGSDASPESNASATETDDNTVIIIDGKKSSVEEMKKIKPEMVDEVIVFGAGSEGAAKWTDSKDKKVIVIQLKK